MMVLGAGQRRVELHAYVREGETEKWNETA